jgi:hypothetical protein
LGEDEGVMNYKLYNSLIPEMYGIEPIVGSIIHYAFSLAYNVGRN